MSLVTPPILLTGSIHHASVPRRPGDGLHFLATCRFVLQAFLMLAMSHYLAHHSVPPLRAQVFHTDVVGRPCLSLASMPDTPTQSKRCSSRLCTCAVLAVSHVPEHSLPSGWSYAPAPASAQGRLCPLSPNTHHEPPGSMLRLMRRFPTHESKAEANVTMAAHTQSSRAFPT